VGNERLRGGIPVGVGAIGLVLNYVSLDLSLA
jgi:hypothetical protein